MTERYGRGSTAPLDANFSEGGTRTLVVADPVKVDILDPDNVAVVTDADPTSNPSVGTYIYEYDVPLGAELGVWTARWTGVINGSAVTGNDPFEVVAAGEVGFTENAFATLAELEAFLGSDIENADGAEQALLAATGAIRAEAKHRISHIGGETKKLHGNWGPRLLLPEPPVTDVESVHIRTPGEAEPVENTGFTWTRHGHLMHGSYFELGSAWGGPDAEVTVVYSHGFDPVPAEIKGLCLQIAARLYDGAGGVQSETIGSYSYTTGDNGSGVSLTDDERRICRRYHPIAE